MPLAPFLKSEEFAWAIVAGALVVAAVAAEIAFGPLGVGMLGFLGILVTMQTSPRRGDGATGVGGTVSRLPSWVLWTDPADRRPAAERERDRLRRGRIRRRMLSLLNAVFIAMAMYGIGLSVIYGIG